MKDESALLQTLRGPEYFGQYGEIEKIVVSKAKPGSTTQGIGVYVTYTRKEDAALCISMVDGTANGDRMLRAQYGTTKYCSAFLRGEICQNKNCSFLHETGEDGQHSSLQNEPHAPKPKPTQAMAPPPRPTSTTQSVSSQPMARQGSDNSDDRKASIDGSALPSSVGWANGPAATKVRRLSQTSRATPSPQITHSSPATQKLEAKPREVIAETPEPEPKTKPVPPPVAAAKPPPKPKTTDPDQLIFDHVLRTVSSGTFRFTFSDAYLSEDEKERMQDFPTLIDPEGGAKRRAMADKAAAERAEEEAKVKSTLEEQATATAEEAMDDVDMGAGSLALGGEPEDNPRAAQARGAISRPPGVGDQFGINSRSLTPQQIRQLTQQSGNLPAPGLQAPTQNTAFEMSDFDRSAPQFSQAQYDQIKNHQRHGSRYFNNDAKSTQSRFQSQQQQGFYTSGVQGPPPGLPTSGTPPVSGGGMFSHGQGFTNPGFGTAKDNTDMHMRARSGTGAGPDAKRELLFSLQNNPLRSPPPSSHAPASALGHANPLYAQYAPGAYQDPGLVKQRKKGKKHRHANTSSSGGVEHLADPSILQARTGNAGGQGQGLYGGANQGGYQQHMNSYGGGGYARGW
jgi:CCR4-NOT transcription complex subunit 4